MCHFRVEDARRPTMGLYVMVSCSAPHMNEAQVHAVELLAQEYDYGLGALHAHKVADLATSLFDQLVRLELLSSVGVEERRTLTAAAYVHAIGASPRARLESAQLPAWARNLTEPERYGELGFHLLRSRIAQAPSDRQISTLTPAQRSLLLYCLLWSGAATAYVVDIEPLFDSQKAMLLAGILRVADGLDCQRRLRVRQVQIQRASAWLRLLVHSYAPVPDEIERARAQTGILSRSLGLRIFVQEVIGE
jgi:hypothetical protein